MKNTQMQTNATGEDPLVNNNLIHLSHNLLPSDICAARVWQHQIFSGTITGTFFGTKFFRYRFWYHLKIKKFSGLVCQILFAA